jgi:hypothetical protein
MKASKLLAAITLWLTAYGCDSSSSADRGRASTAKMEAAATSAAGMTTASRAVVRIAAAQFNDAPAAVADAASPESPPSRPDPLQGINAGSAAPTMVIRTGQAFIEVEKVDAAVLKIRQLAAQVGGYITNSSITGGHDQIRQATFELKIPAPKYDPAVDLLSTIGKVETVTSTAQDVGEEFVDVTARVTNSRRLEERLISLLANRTGKLDEVLRVERELARVREEIERYEGRLRFLSARVALSTLTITVHERAPILGNSPGENPIAAALRRAWKNFIAVVAGSIAALGVAIPLALLGLAGWLGYRRWKRP